MNAKQPLRLTDYASFDVTVERTGAGGFGLVFMGPDRLHNGRWVALKTLRTELLALHSKVLTQLFLDEALTWVGLWPHANLLTAQTVTQIDGRLFLVLDYAASGSLREHLYGQQPFATRVAWAQHIAAGLVALHTPDPELLREQPIVHRDLKPENVLVNEQGYAKITDFGLAAKVEQALPQTSGAEMANWDLLLQVDSSSSAVDQFKVSVQDRSMIVQPGPLQMEPPPLQIEIIDTIPPQDPVQGVIFEHAAPADHYHTRTVKFHENTHEGGAKLGGLGTIAYMPPEQWDVEGVVGPPADLYAFGLILSELLGGRHGLADLEAPLNEEGWYQLHLNARPRPLRNGPAEGADRLPIEIEQLYQALLAKVPADRPTAEQALAVLQQAAAKLGEQPYSNSNLYPRERHSRRIRWNNWASAQYRFNRYEKALECNDRAFALEPSDPDVLNTRANILSAQGLMLRRSGQEVKGRQAQEEALEMLYQSLEETPVSMIQGRKRIHSSLALLLNELGRYQESEAEYGEALTLMPDDFYTWRNRILNLLDWAQVERQDRQFSEARRHLKLALQCVRQSDHLGLNSADVAVMVTSIQKELAEIGA